jgi:adenylate kinase family enzyme
VRRIAVIGCGGSGKTTVARELAQRFGLPVVHADFLVFRDGETPRPEAEWQAELAAIVDAEVWVIDAMKLSTLEHRVCRADLVVFLDLPRRSCLAGLLVRRLRYRGAVDRELGVADRISLDFLRWIWRFRRDARPRILRALQGRPPRTRLVVLRSRRDVGRFLADLPAATA